MPSCLVRYIVLYSGLGFHPGLKAREDPSSVKESGSARGVSGTRMHDEMRLEAWAFRALGWMGCERG